MYLFSELNVFPLILLLVLWIVGGWLIISRIFDLLPTERALIGLAVGLTVSTLLANVLARFMPAAIAFWLAAVLTLAIGVALAWPLGRELFPREAFRPAHWLGFILAVFVLTLMGRGLGLFDDYQNLPQLSSMALGDVPPHFAADARLLWSYHYFLVLVGAQFTRLAGAGPWTALDLARGLTLALALAFGAMLAFRLTRSRIAAGLSVSLLFFAGGARWILFLLPARLLHAASSGVALIGSGADTAPNLALALNKNWAVQGLGPLPFPFAYGSGLDPSLTLADTGYGAGMVMLALLLVLLVGRGRGWRVQSILALLLGALALSNEVTFAFLYIGIILVVLVWALKNRSLRLPGSLLDLAPAFIAGGLLALLQGGVFTGVVQGWIAGLSGVQAQSLYKVSFALRPPAVLSSHLGELSLLNPLDWFVILGETGLVVFALPWVLKYGFELVRAEKWLESAWVLSIVPSILTVFLDYTGNAGPTALSRMTAHFLLILKIYAVPVLWLWAHERLDGPKLALLGWWLATCLSGIALFTLQMAAMPNPVYAEYLSNLDVQMYAKDWGTLEPQALVFDPASVGATTVLGLHAISGTNYGPASNPTWLGLAANPDPYRINLAGYRYVYLDLKSWNQYGAQFKVPCVATIDQLTQTDPAGKIVDMRRLLDVGACH